MTKFIGFFYNAYDVLEYVGIFYAYILLLVASATVLISLSARLLDHSAVDNMELPSDAKCNVFATTILSLH